MRQDIAGLVNLWAADAVVTDARHTPDRPEDDARWSGREAIRDRYLTLVFPANPAINSPADIAIVVEGDRATATSTTRIGQEVSPGGDRWTFVRRGGRWWILELTYNLEPQ
ncbi:MAG: nuclear transport factor 2 family protein [Anaerolineae bacterium]